MLHLFELKTGTKLPHKYILRLLSLVLSDKENYSIETVKTYDEVFWLITTKSKTEYILSFRRNRLW